MELDIPGIPNRFFVEVMNARAPASLVVTAAPTFVGNAYPAVYDQMFVPTSYV